MIFLLIFLYHEFQIFTFAQPYDLFSFLYNSKQIKAFTLCQTMIFLSSFFINQYKFMIFPQFQLIINISYYTLCKDHHFFALSLTIYSNIKSTVLFYTMSNSHNFFAYSFVTKYYFKYKFNSNPIFFFIFPIQTQPFPIYTLSKDYPFFAHSLTIQCNFKSTDCSDPMLFLPSFFTYFLKFLNSRFVQNQSFFFFFQLQLQTDRHGLQVPKVIPEFENTLVCCCPFRSLLVRLKNDSHCCRE